MAMTAEQFLAARKLNSAKGTPLGSPKINPAPTSGMQGSAGNTGSGLSSRGGLQEKRVLNLARKTAAVRKKTASAAKGAWRLAKPALGPMGVLAGSAEIASGFYRPHLQGINDDKNTELQSYGAMDPMSAEAQQGMADLMWRGGAAGGPGHGSPSEVNMTASHYPNYNAPVDSINPNIAGPAPRPDGMDVVGMHQPGGAMPALPDVLNMHQPGSALPAGKVPLPNGMNISFTPEGGTPQGLGDVARSRHDFTTADGAKGTYWETPQEKAEREGWSQSPIDIQNGKVTPSRPDLNRRGLADRLGDVTGGRMPTSMEGFMVANFLQNQLRMDDSRRINTDKDIYKAQLTALPQFMTEERLMQKLPSDIALQNSQAESYSASALGQPFVNAHRIAQTKNLEKQTEGMLSNEQQMLNASDAEINIMARSIAEQMFEKDLNSGAVDPIEIADQTAAIVAQLRMRRDQMRRGVMPRKEPDTPDTTILPWNDNSKKGATVWPL